MRRLTRKVSDGLKHSRYVVVFITEQFLGRNWPQIELESALSKEAASGTVTVIPIVGIQHELFTEHFPLLRDKLYLRWTGDLAHMAQSILKSIGYEFEHRSTHFFPIEYKGAVWLRFVALPENAGYPHRYALRWGPWSREGEFTPPTTNAPVCFDMSKGPDSFAVPLLVEVTPSCAVRVGVGSPPCYTSTDINHGWERA